ncbi:MAG: O-antigen ligase family protein [Candidatus Gracilibacteria bacterium]
MSKIQKYLFYGTIFLLPLIFNKWGFDMYETPKNIILKIGLSLLLLTFLFNDFFSKETKLNISKNQIILVLAFLAILTISTITAIRPQVSFFGSFYRQGGMINMLFYILLFLISLSVFKKKENQLLFLRGLSTVGFAMSIYSILQRLGVDIFSKEITAIFDGRSFSTMGNPTSLGAFLMFPIWGEMALLSLEKNKRFKRKNIAFLIIMIAGLVFTRNRASILALIGSGFLYVLSRFKNNKKILIGLITGLIVLFIGFISIYGADTRSLGSRLTTWDSSLEMIKENPILGYGLESFGYLFESYVKPEFFEFEDYYNLVDRPHNEILEMWIHLGLAGLVFYLLIGLLALKKIFTAEDKIAYFGALAIVSLFISNLFSFSLVTHYAYLAVFLGLIFVGKKEFGIFKKHALIKQTIVIVLMLASIISIGFNFRIFLGDRNLKEAYNNLNENNTEETLIHLEKGINYLPFYAESYFEGYYFYYAFAESSGADAQLMEKAAAYNEKAGAIAHKNNKYYMCLARLFSLQGDYESAEAIYMTALARISVSPNLYEDIGNMYYAAGDYAKASIVYDQLLNVLPDDWEAPILSEEEEFTQGEHIFWKTHPEFINTLNNIATAYYATGQTDKAEMIVEKLK